MNCSTLLAASEAGQPRQMRLRFPTLAAVVIHFRRSRPRRWAKVAEVGAEVTEVAEVAEVAEVLTPSLLTQRHSHGSIPAAPTRCRLRGASGSPW